MIGFPPGHPKAKQGSGDFSKKNTAAPVAHSSFANQVTATGTVEEENGPAITLSEAQFKQFLAAALQQAQKPIPNTSSSSKANAVTQPGLSSVASRNWIIDSGATDHITLSSKLLNKNKNCALPPVLLPSGEKVHIEATGSLPLSTIYYLHVLFVPKCRLAV